MDPTKHLEQNLAGVEVPPEGESFAFPVSFAQGRLWLLSKLIPDASVYNIPMAVRLTGPLDVDALRASFAAILARHEVLRASFQEEDGSPVQVIPATATLEIPFIDLSHLPLQEAVRKAHSLAQESAATGFDLTQGPLLRASLVKLTDQDHVLVLAIHHIVYDAWSRGILWRELSEHYRSLTAGGDANLPELEIQYPDFSVWQRDYLSGETLEEQLQFWKQHLAGAPAVLELPTDRPRPALQTFNGTEYGIVLAARTLESLKELSRHEGATLFMTLLAAFNVLLARYSGQEDIVVGSPIAGRNRAELENLIGFFVNTLPLRTDLSGNPTFKQLLSRVKEAALGAYAHQELPFEKLVEELRLSRELSRNPVFQVMFALQNVSQQKLEFPGLKVEPFRSGKRTTAKFDLSLTANDGPDGLALAFEYNTDLFEAATIERMARAFCLMLTAVAEDSTCTIFDLPLLSETEKHKILYEWNSTDRDFESGLCVHDVVARRCATTPNAIAVEMGGEQLTYAELNAKVEKLAGYLQAKGLQAETLVGIYLERSIEMVIAVLGTLKAGGAYIPLDPAYPPERLSFIVDDAQIAFLLTDSELASKAPASGATVIEIGSVINGPDTSRGSLVSQSRPEHLAYVLYTSGSTGKPKGVQITHANLINFLFSMQREPGFSAEDSLLAVTTLSFDIAGLELYLPLISGGRVVLASREDAADGRALRQLLEQHRPTVMQATPATWRMLIESGWKGTPELTVLCGGEALPSDLALQLVRRCRQLWNMYGPTETTIWSSLQLVRDVSAAVSIGRPIANTSFYVLDSHQQPVPVGVAGELYIGGGGVARGYLNRPELTTERFVTDPYSKKPAARMYRTGDLARYLPDGTVEYLGRTDFQVKIRGFRIELGEIENQLAKHESVQQAVVAAREDAPGDKRLVAYVVCKPGEHLPLSDCRAHLKQTLPDYMVPSAVVELSTLPLTPNGKIDRKALPAPEYGTAEAKGEFIAPRTPTEEIIAGIWAQVLNISRIGIHDNFFELGGHSLLAMQAISRISRAFSIDLPLLALFETPTVAGLSEKAAALQAKKSAAHALRLDRIPRTKSLQLSFAQQRLWFLDRLEPQSALYNVPLILRLTGTLNLKALRRTLNRILARHESLRTWFRSEAGAPVQMITPTLEVDLALLSVMNAPERVRETEARSLIHTEVGRPFDLATGPLVRVMLVKIAETDHVLVINTHHIISDRWSLGVLRDELVQFYEQEVQGDVQDITPLPIQYADYAAWQRQLLSGEVLEEQLRYWKQKMIGAPASLDLPTDRPRPAEQSYRGAISTFEIPKDLSEKLLAVGRREGATLYMTLLAAFNILVSRYSGQDDIVIGSPIAGRSRPELERLIGFFVNTLLLRTQVANNESFPELLARVRETAMEAYAHQDVPFEKLVEELRPQRDLSRNPLFQVVFTTQNAVAMKQKMGGLDINGVPTSGTTSKFDLSVTASERDSGLRLIFEYATDLFNSDRIERMQRHFLTLLEGIVTNPDCLVGDLTLLAESEREQVLHQWNPSERYPVDVCIHHRFEEQVKRNPDHIAVACEGQSLSYAELNARSNQLARHLMRLGVGPEVLVGLCVERSLEMVVAILAIVKAGGAYLPLDPRYPKDRLAFMVEDAKPAVVLTQRELQDSVPQTASHILLLDADWNQLADEDRSNVDSPVRPDNLAYVIYTSGSTGRPKGCQVTHANVVRLFDATYDWYRFDDRDVWTMFHSYAFDFSVWELWGALIYGGRLVVVPYLVSRSPEEFYQLLITEKVTVLNQTPSSFRQLMQIEEKLDSSADLSLRYVVFGGEALDLPSLKPWFDRHGDQTPQLINMYGITETTVHVTYRPLTLADTTAGSVIGRPIPDLQLYLLDSRRQPVPVGVPGEIYVGGAGVARGYLNRPELNAERFIADPFRPSNGHLLYKSGDLACRLANGDLEYLGRIDQQVKIRGFRIELGEIENSLANHPAVQQALVLVREDSYRDKYLVGYVVPKPSQKINVGEIRDHLRQNLPDYMVPAALVELDAFPLTTNGKIDRKALPEPNMADRAAGKAVPPRDHLEEMILVIWQRVLQNQSMGVTDNFFELGGHSLMAAQLISEMESMFRRKIPLAALFRGATVEQMARVLREGSESDADPIVMRIQPGHTIPFFAVVAPGADSIGYAAMARAMGPQQTVYKLQTHRPLRPDAPIGLDDMRIIAADYVRAMRTVQPKGPYYLGGMCLGTHIGEQMVLQLETEGEKVALFAIFDTWVRQNSHVRWKWKISYYRQRVRGLLRMSFRNQWKMIGDALSKKLHHVTRMQRPVETSFARLYWPGKDFKTPHFHAPVALFKRPKQPFYYIKDETLGWGERSQGGVHIYRIDFPHQMLREPYVRELAKRLLESISRTAPVPVERLQVWPKVSDQTPSTADIEA